MAKVSIAVKDVGDGYFEVFFDGKRMEFGPHAQLVHFQPGTTPEDAVRKLENMMAMVRAERDARKGRTPCAKVPASRQVSWQDSGPSTKWQ